MTYGLLTKCEVKMAGYWPRSFFANEANIYMLFAGWEGRIAKNCDRGLENAARGRRPRAAFSSLRSQFFTIQTDPKPANNLFIKYSNDQRG